MGEVPAWAQTVLGALGAGIAIYAGIRADLARITEIASHARDAAHRAHDRIDSLMRDSTGHVQQNRKGTGRGN